MALKLIKTTRVGGGKCAVKIYRNTEYDVHEVRTLIGKRAVGNAEESDLKSARGTAAAEARWLKTQSGCR